MNLRRIGSILSALAITRSAAAFECRAADECEPCLISGGDDKTLSEEAVLARPLECQPWRRTQFAKQAACDETDTCKLDYSRAVTLLEPLQCVQKPNDGDACDLHPQWKKSIEIGRALLERLSRRSALEVTIENLPDGANVELAGSHKSHKLNSSNDTQRLLDLEPGTYTLKITADSQERLALPIELKAGTSLTTSISVPPLEACQGDDPDCTRPPQKAPCPLGFWLAGSAVLDKNFSGGAGVKGAGALTIAPLQWLDVDVGVAGSRLFWGGLLGGKAIVDWRSLRFAAEPHLLIFGGRGEAARGVLWGLHLGGRVGYRWDDAYTLFVAPAAEVYPDAEPYDSVLYLASIGFEWRKQ